MFFNKDPYLLSFLGGQILSSPTRILCPLSFLGGQSLSSSIRIPCLLRFLGGQTLSIPCLLKLLGGLDNFIAVQVTWLPLNSLIVTDFVHFYIACVCLSVSLQFLCHEVTVVTRYLSSIVICKCISLATDPPPLVPHNYHFILFLTAFYTREIFQLIHNERLIHCLLFFYFNLQICQKVYNFQSTWTGLAATCLIIFYFIFFIYCQ